MPAEHNQVGLDVVADLLDGRIDQHRRQQRQRLGLGQREAAAEAFVAKRDVAGHYRASGNGNADQRRAHRRRAVGDHLHAEPLRDAQLLDQRGELVGGSDQRVILRHRRSGRREFGHQRAEAEPREQLITALARGTAIAKRLDVERHLHVGADGHQHLALPRLVGVLEQAFAILLLLDLAGMFQQRIERPVLRDQFACALVANAGHALDIVAGVAHQRQHVDHLRRRHAKLLHHALGVEPGALVFWVIDLDHVVDELEEVLVARHDRRVQAMSRRLARQCPNHIVRLKPLGREDGDSQCFARLEHPRNLFGQVARHGRAVGLVVRRHLRAEGLAAHVERGGDVLRLMIGNQLAEHVDEAVDGIGGLAVGSGQAANRVVGAIHLVAAVDQEERGLRHRPYIIPKCALLLAWSSSRSCCPPRAAASSRASTSTRKRFFSPWMAPPACT